MCARAVAALTVLLALLSLTSCGADGTTSDPGPTTVSTPQSSGDGFTITRDRCSGPGCDDQATSCVPSKATADLPTACKDLLEIPPRCLQLMMDSDPKSAPAQRARAIRACIKRARSGP